MARVTIQVEPPIEKVVLELTLDEAEQIAGVLGRVCDSDIGTGIYHELLDLDIRGDSYYEMARFSPPNDY